MFGSIVMTLETHAYKIIKEYINGKTILVHCAAGMQRSAASIAFMLIAYKMMNETDAMKYIKERRNIAFHPRANFGRSIEYFYKQYQNNILPGIKRP